MWTHVASNALTLLIVAFAAAAGVIGWGVSEYRSAGPLDGAICLRVAPGSTMADVSEQLEDQGAVSSPAIYRIAASYTDRADDLKAGSFIVPEGASMSEILATVTEGGRSTCGTEIVLRIGVTGQEVQVRDLDPETGSFAETVAFDPAAGEAPDAYNTVRGEPDARYRVALAEGATSWQIVEALNAADFLQGEVSEIPAEGSLAPDSYEIAPGADRADLLATMQGLQAQRLAAAWDARAENVPLGSPEDALVLASIIEKETGVAEERRQVASVFVNRLRDGMRLQTDPTVIYGITNGEGTLGRGLRRSELDAPTPYNTYQIDGLPPTPIANPGLEAIEAAVRPAETDYYYFVADGTGGHAFAETLDEHNENVARWRQIEAERASQ